LKDLSIIGNRIEALPYALGNITTLRVLRVEGNPLRIPPKEIAKKGIKDIMGYLRELAVDSGSLYRTKLMIVGQGRRGVIRGSEKRY
jgi:internalin A